MPRLRGVWGGVVRPPSHPRLGDFSDAQKNRKKDKFQSNVILNCCKCCQQSRQPLARGFKASVSSLYPSSIIKKVHNNDVFFNWPWPYFRCTRTEAPLTTNRQRQQACSTAIFIVTGACTSRKQLLLTYQPIQKRVYIWGQPYKQAVHCSKSPY